MESTASDVVIVTYEEAARRLGGDKPVGKDRVLELVASGDLQSVKLGPRTRRITVASIDAFVARLVARGLAEEK